MKIICAPDSFKESMSAVEAADAMATGVSSVLQHATVDRCPAGDGGGGTLASLFVALSGNPVPVKVHDALGTPFTAAFGQFEGFCWVETAAAIGLDIIPAADRDIMRSSSLGAGELLAAAVATSARKILVGVGGSATNDGGCGMAQALGIRFFDVSGRLISQPVGGSALKSLGAIDLDKRVPIDVPIKVACDVTNPLTGSSGAAQVFGPQKGATPGNVRELDEGLANLADLVRRDIGIDVEQLPGAGASGGLAAGLVAFAGAEIVSGVDTVLDAIGFDARLSGADLCLTGEGRLDGQSLAGKTCIGVARRAMAADVPVIALVGSVGEGADRCSSYGINEYIEIGRDLTPTESIKHAADLLVAAAAGVAARYT